MPTIDRQHAEILRALMSVAECTLTKVEVGQVTGYRLTMTSTVVLDGDHARSLARYAEIEAQE
jgi:hypothetical protein